LVQEVTQGTNLLDQVFTNRPDLLCTTVHQSLLKTKHMADVTTDVNCTGGDQSSCRRQHVKLCDHRTHNIDRLRYAVALYDWSYVNTPRMTSGRITYKLTWGEFFTPLLFVHILKLIY